MSETVKELVTALRWQLESEMPSTHDLLPNRAGDAQRRLAALLQGYLGIVGEIEAALAAPAPAESAVLVDLSIRLIEAAPDLTHESVEVARDLMDLAQPTPAPEINGD